MSDPEIPENRNPDFQDFARPTIRIFRI